jgi:hypothetical protein
VARQRNCSRTTLRSHQRFALCRQLFTHRHQRFTQPLRLFTHRHRPFMLLRRQLFTAGAVAVRRQDILLVAAADRQAARDIVSGPETYSFRSGKF